MHSFLLHLPLLCSLFYFPPKSVISSLVQQELWVFVFVKSDQEDASISLHVEHFYKACFEQCSLREISPDNMIVFEWTKIIEYGPRADFCSAFSGLTGFANRLAV